MKLRGYLFAAATAITAAVGLTAPAQAASLFNAGGPVSFGKDTRVEFKFHASHGAFQSTLSVYDENRNPLEVLFTETIPRDPLPGKNPQYNKVDSIGTCGITVNPAPCITTYHFLAGVQYYLGLKSEETTTIVFSDDPVGGATPGGFKFVADVPSVSYPTRYAPPTGANFKSLVLQNGETAIFVNDPSTVDVDANDFIVTAKSVPEPATLAGLGVVAAGLIASRRRESDQTA
jgi:hypothetical protein